jgi:hypothetical protein
VGRRHDPDYGVVVDPIPCWGAVTDGSDVEPPETAAVAVVELCVEFEDELGLVAGGVTVSAGVLVTSVGAAGVDSVGSVAAVSAVV